MSEAAFTQDLAQWLSLGGAVIAIFGGYLSIRRNLKVLIDERVKSAEEKTEMKIGLKNLKAQVENHIEMQRNKHDSHHGDFTEIRNILNEILQRMARIETKIDSNGHP